jgi:hypothetical protein
MSAQEGSEINLSPVMGQEAVLKSRKGQSGNSPAIYRWED